MGTNFCAPSPPGSSWHPLLFFRRLLIGVSQSGSQAHATEARGVGWHKLQRSPATSGQAARGSSQGTFKESRRTLRSQWESCCDLFPPTSLIPMVPCSHAVDFGPLISPPPAHPSTVRQINGTTGTSAGQTEGQRFVQCETQVLWVLLMHITKLTLAPAAQTIIGAFCQVCISYHDADVYLFLFYPMPSIRHQHSIPQVIN